MNESASNAPESRESIRPLGAIPTGQAPQTRPVKPVSQLQAWIIIALLALILAVGVVGVVMQVAPARFGGGEGASFVPNQSFQGTPDQGTQGTQSFQSTPS